MDNILETVKEICDISPSDTSFDTVLKIHINTVLFTLRQLGVINEPMMITSGKEKWDDVIGDNEDLEAVKTYVGLKVKKLLDPPTSGVLKEALEESIKEFEWRLNVQVDPGWEKMNEQ